MILLQLLNLINYRSFFGVDTFRLLRKIVPSGQKEFFDCYACDI